MTHPVSHRLEWQRTSSAVVASLLIAGGAVAASHDEHAGHRAAAPSAADAHAGREGHAAGRDAEGRRFHNMKHKMPPEMYDELRQKIALYRDYTNQQIDLSMVQMGSEYQWYISPAGVKGEQGLLILSHGFRDVGDRMFKQQLEPLAEVFPTSLAIGMAMMMSDHVQASIDDLEAAGAKEIVVVPVVSSRNNELKRQWDYILGQREKAEFATVPQAKAKAKLIFANPPEDDPMIAEILLDYAKEISTDPSKEMVIVVAHGATSDEDNAHDLKVLNSLAKIVREDGGFAEATGIALQDDAPAEVRKKNVMRLRELVAGAASKGRKVLIVTNLIGARTIQAKLRSDLKDLDYSFNAKGIAQHENFVEWLGEEVRHQLEAT